MADLHDIIDTTQDVRLRRKHPLRAGIVVSSFFHTTLIAIVFVAPYILWAWFAWPPADRELTITVVASTSRVERRDEPQVRAITDPSEVSGQAVEKKLNQVIDAAETRSGEENLDQLEVMARRLEDVSSDSSVDELAAKFHGWLGTKPRATQPATELVAGEFDYDTAQIHDVRREPTDNGDWQYFFVLLDAEGRTIEVEMDAAEGESVYRTMQRLKAFPLAEKVYRQITVPLLDKLINDSRNNGPAEAISETQSDEASEEPPDAQ